jgi:hypothetical protein
MEENDFKGLWIPREIWEMKNLNITEKCFMSVIYNFQNNGKECSASNAWFANLFGISKKHASQILNTLSRKKRIGIQIYRDRVSGNIRKRVSRIIGIPIPKKTEGTYIDYKKKYIKKSDRKEFIAPDFSEILKFFENIFKEKNMEGTLATNEANKFFYHYSANGWRIGNTPMDDWQAAAKKWILGLKEKGVLHEKPKILT